MADHRTLRSRTSFLRSAPLRGVLSLGIVLGVGGVSTLAYWTDSATVTGGEFLTGTLDVKLNGVDNEPVDFTTNLGLANMQPGQSKAAIVSVQNVGTTDFTYTATGTAPGPLAQHLVVRVVPGGAVAGSGSAQTCTGGTEAFTGTLGTSPVAVIGTDRPLASEASENVCVQVTLPTGVTGAQGLSTTTAFQFDAKQVGAP